MIIASVLLWGGMAGILGLLFFRRGRGRVAPAWWWLLALCMVVGFVLLCLGYDSVGN